MPLDNVGAGSPSPTTGQAKETDMGGRRLEGQELPCPDLAQGWRCWNATKSPSRLASTDRDAVWLLPTPQCPAGVVRHEVITGRGRLGTSCHERRNQQLTSVAV